MRGLARRAHRRRHRRAQRSTRSTSPTWARPATTGRRDSRAPWSTGSEPLSPRPPRRSRTARPPAPPRSSTGSRRWPPGCATWCWCAAASACSEVNNFEATEFVSYLSHRYAEYLYGVTLPALAGMFARLYMDRYGVAPGAPGHGGDQEPRQRRAEPQGAPAHPGDHGGPPHRARRGDEQPVDRRAAALLRLLPGERRRRGRAPGARVDGARSSRKDAGAHRRHRPGHRHARGPRAARPDRADGGAARRGEGLRHGGPRPGGHRRGRAARRLHHPRDRRERGGRLLPEGPGAHGARARRDADRRPAAHQPLGRAEGARATPSAPPACRRSSSWCCSCAARRATTRCRTSPKNGFAVNFGGFGNNVLATVLKRGV